MLPDGNPEPVDARHRRLLERLDRDGRIATTVAAADFGTSVDTIRRDLRALHEQGHLRRVHGGAVPLSPLSPSFNGRRSDESPERSHLADAVVRRLQPGQVVGLDAGTTTTEIAARLPPSLEITIVTNNPAAAVALADHRAATVLLLGGELDLRWMAATGPATVEAIRDHHLDLAVVGACAFDLDSGATTRSQREVATKRAFIAAASETVVPLERAKLGTVAPFAVVDASEVGLLLDPSADPAFVAAARAAGLTVDLA